MNIGFDGKRAYQNKTGLGNYIRSLLAVLIKNYPSDQYTLFAPKETNLFDAKTFEQVRAVFPISFPGKQFPGWWRNKGMVADIARAGLDIYHGVSNELPRGIEHAGVKTVVTVHDLIYERYPETYHFDERYVHRWKIKRACRVADAVIAISQQTRDDLVDFYGVPPGKIFICYQSCNPIFHRVVPDAEKAAIKRKYHLPEKYFLFVSSIAPRKNLITICRSLVRLKDKLHIPLVVIGNGKKEKEEARQYMQSNGINDRLVLLNELPVSKESDFTTAADFPGIYQQALALVYPSLFEGFGAPLLEAICSGLPVISSNSSSLPEVAGDAALYFSPMDDALLAEHLLRVATEKDLAQELKRRGFEQAQHFTVEKYAASMHGIYQQVAGIK